MIIRVTTLVTINRSPPVLHSPGFRSTLEYSFCLAALVVVVKVLHSDVKPAIWVPVI